MTITATMIQGDGITIGEILSGIPHDTSAIVVYVLLAAFVGFIWWGNRHGYAKRSADTESTPPSASGKERD